MPHSEVTTLGTIDLVSEIVDDARDLVGAHVDGLREDISSRLATLTSMMIAAGVFVVTALLLGLALAAPRRVTKR